MKKICSLLLVISLLFIMITTNVFADDVMLSNAPYLGVVGITNGFSKSDYVEGATGTMNMDGESVDVRVIYIDTPNTVDGVLGFEILKELSGPKLINITYTFSSLSATRLAPATAKYNCHSYAWYSQSELNTIWINDPSAFYSDGSYCEVSTPKVGDIICYFDDKGTATTSDDSNEHSGVVTAVSSGISNGLCGNSDLVTVTSKWGYGGLYSHNGYVCPYTSYNSTGKADYVKYYRLHSVNYTDLGLLEGHRGICHGCGYYVEEGHDWSEMASFYMCRKCGHKSSHIPVAPNNIPEDILLKIQQKATLNEFAIDVDENTVLCYIDGQYYMVKGHTTDNALSYIKSASVVK